MLPNDAGARTILIAEDEADVREMLRLFLQGEGYRVIEVGDGERAVEAALRERPDLILMDLNMPDTDGIEATRRIRQTPGFADLPILAQSGYGEFGMRFTNREDEFGPGFTFYLTKPIELDELRHILHRLLRESDEP